MELRYVITAILIALAGGDSTKKKSKFLPNMTKTLLVLPLCIYEEIRANRINQGDKNN